MYVIHYVCRICRKDFGSSKTAKKRSEACEKLGRPKFAFKAKQLFERSLDGQTEQLTTLARKVGLLPGGKKHRARHIATYLVLETGPGRMNHWVPEERIVGWGYRPIN